MKTEDLTAITLRSVAGTKVVNENLLRYDRNMNSVFYKPWNPSTSRDVLYWKLPSVYCGDKVGFELYPLLYILYPL